jgi:hypothetical protein
VGGLLLIVATGLFGSMIANENAAMMLFWVVFMLGFTYLTALLGDLYQLINPWRTLLEWIERFGVDFSKVRVAYPEWLGYYPAFAFYVAMIWLALFALPDPRYLAWMLIGYSALNLAAAALFGKAAWFHFGEMFSVLFRLIGTLAPVEYQPRPFAAGAHGAGGSVSPFIGGANGADRNTSGPCSSCCSCFRLHAASPPTPGCGSISTGSS